MSMIADDLFAGAGGWELAAEQLVIHARGIENMPAACATRDAAGLTTIHDDVWTYEPDGQAQGLIASPPCQTFSKAGQGSGRKALDDVLTAIRRRDWRDLDLLKTVGEKAGDDRTALVLTPLHFAMQHGYEWLAWEQVPTVLPVWEACADTLRAYGWSAWAGLLHSEMFGVPQTRTRAFLFASRNGVITGPPTPTHSRYHSRTPEKLDPGVDKWVSMARAIGWSSRIALHPTLFWTADRPATTVLADPRIAAAGHHISHQLAKATPSDEARSWRPTPAIEGERGEDITWPYDRPSPTIVGTFAPDVVAAPGYRKAGDPPRQKTPGSVRVTVEEAGVLQSFPADYPWNGGPKDSSGKKYLQAGNAVPPLMALHALSAATGIAIPSSDAEENVA